MKARGIRDQQEDYWDNGVFDDHQPGLSRFFFWAVAPELLWQ
jgi:hypothetical protein